MVHEIPKFTIVPVMQLWVRKISGMENIPKNGAFIVAANHSSYMDHMIISTTLIPYLDKKIHYLAKKEHFDNFIERKWHNYVGCISIDRESGGKKALKHAVNALKEGKIIAIYPEGTRTLTGKLQKVPAACAIVGLSQIRCGPPGA